jgi:beta-xylosidase
MKTLSFLAFILATLSFQCTKEAKSTDPLESEWKRYENNPVLRDSIATENYESASDPHVFFDDDGQLRMIYSGDVNGVSSIKMATGTSWTNWKITDSLLTTPGPLGRDVAKETSFYVKAPNGKHQIYYIGYPDDGTYKSEIYLAEADQIDGPYTQIAKPVVPRGNLAGHEVYLITSPTVNEHDGLLYMSFIGWDAFLDDVTEVWIIGATSSDNGHTWKDFKDVETRIGMEGQVTKGPDGTFYAVRTGEFENREAIFISTANHPFGPWTEEEKPILVKSGDSLEVDETIAPQIIIDPQTNVKHLYYTGAHYAKGWWIMLATNEQ